MIPRPRGSGYDLFVTWTEFVRALGELDAMRGETDFAMRIDEHAGLELRGKLRLDRDHAEEGEIKFRIERPDNEGGGFLITEAAWGDAAWLPAQAPAKALQIRMAEGHPIFSLRVEASA